MPGLWMVCFHYCSITSPMYTMARRAMHSILGTSMAQLLSALLREGSGHGASS